MKRNICGLAIAAVIIVGFVNFVMAKETLDNWERMSGHEETVGGISYVISYCGTSVPWSVDLALIMYASQHQADYSKAYNKAKNDLTANPFIAGLTSALMCPIVQRMVNERTSWRNVTAMQ